MLQVVENSFSCQVTSDIKSTKSLHGGLTDKVMGTVEGEKVMIKAYDSDSEECLAEYMCYKLGEKIGIKVNRVKLITCGELFGLTNVCSVHWWEDNFTVAGKLRQSSSEICSDEEENIKEFFDLIIRNSDRHDYNYGKLNNELFLIDNGFAHPWFKDISEGRQKQLVRILKEENEFTKLKEVIDNFVSIADYQFDAMFKLPQDFDNIKVKVKYQEQINYTIQRFQLIQMFIKGYRRAVD